MLNVTVLTGRITRDLELQYTSSNIAYTRFTLAVDRQFKDSTGESVTDFISCVAWRKTAELICEHLSKGSLIGVQGRIETRQYDKDGTTVYVTEVLCDNVQFLESKKEERKQPQKQQTPDEVYQSVKETTDDDLPF